ncbi:hypothetical protein PTKIN_Ptkin01aG0009500 [Pterospermum kingtungense]
MDIINCHFLHSDEGFPQDEEFCVLLAIFLYASANNHTVSIPFSDDATSPRPVSIMYTLNIRDQVAWTFLDAFNLHFFNSQVTVCQTCGDKGYDVALIYCDKCQTYAIHRYCLYKLPKTFDEYVVWYCEDCEPEVQRQSSLSFQLPENLESDETPRTSLAVGAPSSTQEDRLIEAETPPSNTRTHSMGSDWVDINEGAENFCVDCEPVVQRQSSPSLQLPENLEKDETQRTSLAVGWPRSNEEDRLIEAETPPSNTCTHSMGSDWVDINEGAENFCADHEREVQRESSPSLQLPENLENIETQRTSLAVGGPSSNEEDRFNEAEMLSSNTYTHSTGSDWVKINEGAESVDNRTSLVAITEHLNVKEHILEIGWKEPDKVCSHKEDSKTLAEENTKSSNKIIAGDQTVVDDPGISSTISPMCIAAEDKITNSSLQKALPIPSSPQKTNPLKERGKCMSENQQPPTVGSHGGDFSVEGQNVGTRPCTTEGVGNQSIGASVSFTFHIFDDLNSEGIVSADKSGKSEQRYLVKPSLVSTLDAIIKKHGDIAQDSLTSAELLTPVVERVCQAVKDLEASAINKLQSSFLTSLGSTLSDAELLNLNVKWLRERYDELNETFSELLQYKKLKVDRDKYSAMIQSGQKAIELKRTKVKKLQSDIQSQEIEVASMAAKVDEVNKTMSSIKSKFRKIYRESLVNGLI